MIAKNAGQMVASANLEFGLGFLRTSGYPLRFKAYLRPTINILGMSFL